MHEEGVVGTSADDADLDAVLGVPSSESIEDCSEAKSELEAECESKGTKKLTVDVLASVQEVDGALTVDLEGVLIHGKVDGSPL